MSNYIKPGKKIFTVVVVLATIVWSIGIFSLPVAFAATSGDLIKITCTGSNQSVCSAVYYLGADGKRYVFPNEKTFKTWYADFSSVKNISQTEMESYMIGGNATYRPGVKMVKIQTDPKVYAVAKNGTLRWVKTEEVAKTLYGNEWNKSIDDVADAFFVNYTIGSEVAVASSFDKTAETAAATTINTDKNLGGGGAPVGGSTLTVALASDTPAAGIAVNGAARVPFTKVSLTASADGDVTVDTWTVERKGLGQDAAFSSVDILDSNNFPINDSGKTFSSEHTANVTEDLVIPAGTTKTVVLAGNMAASLTSYAGETPALALKAITLKGTGTVVGTLPIIGNYQTINATISIGSATVQRGSYVNSTNTSLEVGKTAYTLFSFQIQAGSAEDIEFSQLKVYQKGSASLTSDLKNLKLYADTTLLSDKGEVSGSYITYTFPSLKIPKGQTKQYKIDGDVISGSSRTVQLGIYRTTDLLVKGTTFSYNITPTYSGTGTGAASPVIFDNQHTISTGTLRVGRSSTVAAGNITVGSDQTIGAFEFEAKGEPVIVSALTLTIASTTSGTIIEDAFRSVKIVDENGTTVAGPSDITDNALTVAFTDTFTVPTGIHVYKVVGNINTAGGWTTNDTIYARLATPGSAITAKGETTGLTITPTPSSNIDTSTQTLKTANITVTKNSQPTSKTVITNQAGVLIGSWTFDGTNAGEDVRITSLGIRASTTGKINNLTLKDGTKSLSPVNSAPTAGANVTSTFALSEPIIVTKGTSKVINLYGDIGSNANTGEVDAWGITSSSGVTAYGVTTGNSATVTVVASNGALLTIAGAGTLTVNLGPTLPARMVVAGTTGVDVADINLKAANEDVDITQLVIGVVDGALTGTGAGDYTQVAKIYLKLDGTVIGDSAGYSIGQGTLTVSLSRGALTIPQSVTAGKNLQILADIVQMGTNQAGVNNADIKVGIRGANGIIAYGNGSNSTASETYTDSTGSAIIIHKAIPQVDVSTKPATSLAAGTLHSAKITAVGGRIGVYRMTYEMQTSTGLTLASQYIKLASCAGGCMGMADGTQLSAVGTRTLWGDASSGKSYVSFVINQGLSGKYYLDIAAGATATVTMHGTIGAFQANNTDYTNTTLLGGNASSMDGFLVGEAAASFTAITTNNNSGNFVWSDLNRDDSNSTGSLTNTQWFGGYLVPGLGTQVSSLAQQVNE